MNAANAVPGGSPRALRSSHDTASVVARLACRIASENYLVLLVGIATTLLLLGLGYLVTPDTWLALVSGRAVAGGGPPSTDTLTGWASGRDWIDQQWLGQLVLYEIWRLGGLVLVGFAHVAIVIGAFVAGIAGARRRGGSSRHVALVGLLAALPIGLVAGNIRTQTFALALFVAVLWLAAADSHTPSGRVFWGVPLLVLWANVHGSVIVGAGMMMLAGLVGLVGSLRGGGRSLLHDVALIAFTPLTLLATPYGTRLLSYFHDTFGNAEIAAIAPDWMPIKLEPVHFPLFALAGLTAYLLGAERGRLSAFEELLIPILLLGAFAAERNLVWFALAALILVPQLLTQCRASEGGAGPPLVLALVVTAMVCAGVLAAAVRGAGASDRQVQSRFPSAAATVVARTAQRDPSLGLFVHPRYADWLLFGHPRLEGRVPFDIRYELLTPAELRRFRRFRDQVGEDWWRSMGDARLIVLDSSERPLGVLPSTAAVLRRERGARQLLADHDVAIVLRPRGAR